MSESRHSQMPPTEHSESSDAASGRPAHALGLALARNFALQDYVLLTMHTYLVARSFLAPPSPRAAVARPVTLALWTATAMALLLTRGELMKPGPLRAWVYRLGLFLPAIGSYFALRALLHAIDVPLVDARLLAFERSVIGETPAVALQAWATPATVEWFAFFYAFYFVLIGLHVIGTMLMDERRRGEELLAGATFVLSFGHICYTLLPGVGPYAFIPEAFAHPLAGGPIWRAVQAAVAHSGALRDIFPSLHTAFPTLFTLHAFRHRHSLPYRWTWAPTGLVAGNMILSTMVLRWHYGVDVIAGLALAVTAQATGVIAAGRPRKRGAQPAWESVRPAGVPRHDYLLVLGLVSLHLSVVVMVFLLAADGH